MKKQTLLSVLILSALLVTAIPSFATPVCPPNCVMDENTAAIEVSPPTFANFQPGIVLLTDDGVVTDAITFTSRLGTFSFSDGDSGTSDISFVDFAGSLPSEFANGCPTTGDAGTLCVQVPEVGSETNNGAFYTPTDGQPGYLITAIGVSPNYEFVSDGSGPPSAVPEPSSMLLLGTGLLGAVGAVRRKLFG